MPVFINEVTAEVPQPVVPEVEAKPADQQTPVIEPVGELLKKINLIEERRQRLQFD